MSNEKETVELFNQNYIKYWKTPQASLGDCVNVSQDELTIKEIISVYSNHPSIQKIKTCL